MGKVAKIIQQGEDSLANEVRKTGYSHGKRIKLGPYLTAYTKFNSKWAKDLRIRTKTIRLLEENTGGNHSGIRFGSDFLNTTPEAQVTEEKQTSWTSKLKPFVHQKDVINRVKRQPTERETIFANHKSDKGLIY